MIERRFWLLRMTCAFVVTLAYYAPSFTSIAQAENVHLDFTGVAWPALGTAAAIEGAITAEVVADYAEFPWLTFSTTPSTGGPGPLATDTVLEFGDTGSGLGVAWVVDWDNKVKAHNNIVKPDDTAGAAIDVFVANFVSAGSPFTDTLAKFSTAVGGTASHELGHALGLRHFDTFGPSAIAGNPNPIPDHHIMASGSTGLFGTDRTDYDRAFSEHSRDKLHYLDPLNQPLRKRAELMPAAGAHGSFPTAEPLTLGPADLIPAVGREIMVKDAFLHAGEADYYAVPLMEGDRIYANTFSSRLSDSTGLGPGSGFDTVLALHKPDMSTVIVNDDIGYNSTSSGTPGIGDSDGDPGIGDSDGDLGANLTKKDLLRNELFSASADGESGDSPFSTRSTDSIVLDSPSGEYFTIDTTGVWFLEVFGFDTGDTGDYELFVAVERVPEPGTVALLLLGACAVLGVRRRR